MPKRKISSSSTVRDDYPRRKEHVVWKVIDQKGVLLNLENGEYFETGPVGLFIWQQCDGTTDLDRIAQSIARKFQSHSPRVAQDVRFFLAELKRQKLVGA